MTVDRLLAMEQTKRVRNLGVGRDQGLLPTGDPRVSESLQGLRIDLPPCPKGF
jgi:hypothetical protein